MRFAWVLLCLPIWAQTDPAVKAARQYRQAHEREIVSSLMDLLTIPAVAANPDGLRKAATEISARLQKRGAQVRLLEHPGSAPVVYGEIRRPGATRTVLFYAHYDGQPVNPKDWVTPPFQPTLRNAPLERDGQIIPLPEPGKPFDPEWRIYARSASDDKAPVVSILTALDALRAAKIEPTANLKFVFEGEEEAGSPHLEQILAANKQLLAADVWLICDGPVHQSRTSQIVFGVRGVVAFELTVYGARRELHSGHYGNWSPNPAMQLAQLLASMKDAEGRVIIDGYNDGAVPLGPLENQAIADAPEIDEALKKELWLGRTEGAGRKLADLINLPSLNVRGLTSARTGDTATNVIPASATASIDIRLVKGITPAQAIARLRAHIQKQGYTIVNRPPDGATRLAHPKLVYFEEETGGYEAVRTPMDLPVSQMVLKAAERARTPVIRLPTLGGSLPLIMIERQLNVRTITIPIANHDNSQHSSNENLRLQNLWDGIDLMAALLTMN
ncbi:MAG: M20/M25/M40 family metallo-hydrolase [Bryobacteraceae bacterium]|nr:M20/M25/M40 family metallo-hydrolase [Bryobacteraceae bacterium]